MTIAQQAEIAEEALQAAANAPKQGFLGAITQGEIQEAMSAFLAAVQEAGANANTLIPIFPRF